MTTDTAPSAPSDEGAAPTWQVLYTQKKYTTVLRLIKDLKDPEARYTLGRLYWYGDGVPSDRAEAFKHFTAAADKGLPAAIDAVGCAYARGEGVKLDVAKGIKLLKQSASMGHLDSFRSLGNYYYNNRNYDEAVRAYRNAGEQNQRALSELGDCYERGRGVPANRTKAIQLFERAGKRGASYLGHLYAREGNVLKAVQVWTEGGCEKPLAYIIRGSTRD